MKRFLTVIGIASILILVLGATAFAAHTSQQGTPQAGSTPAPTAPASSANPVQGSSAQQDSNSLCCGMMSGGMMGGGMMGRHMTGVTIGTLHSGMGFAGDDMIRMMAGTTPMHADVEKLLGMTHQDLYNQMAAGKSLAQIAASRGVTETQLIHGIMAGRQVAVDQAVAAGHMTRTQADAMLQYMENNVETMVNTPGMAFGISAGMGWNTQPSQPRQAGQQNQSGQTGGAGSGNTNSMGFGRSSMHQ